jgi:hypothetical protein
MRDCYLLNSNCGQGEYAKEEQEMLYFFGILIGYAILSTQVMELPMHPTFWKKVVNYQTLTSPTDLQSSDVHAYNWVKELRKNAKSFTKEVFD